MTTASSSAIAFIGGGNMASALIGGLRRSGVAAADIIVVEPWAEQRERLRREFEIVAHEQATPALAAARLVVWAVKPQLFQEAAAPCRAHVAGAAQLSVMAGIRSDAIVRASGSERVVRAMPNTPALIGQGIAGLYARPEVGAQERAGVETLLAPTGRLLWVDREADLDAVTALSASGPAYVFLFLEAFIEAARDMGLSAEQGRALALGTFAGATALAEQSPEPPAVLRERVTSKGGTTHAALSAMQADGVREAIVRAVRAAQRRAAELGDEFGR
ncbi:MAG: pyrroline-5-carboxylate reductase [Methylibium sp.]|uniref:pyrroline-5-carboxylate reductase n=1 Tax=Methylibium sp. TaxID=2067992 RepID=UPI001821FEB1|nr:pyrroline-5-carboxylate reductase [Methylibium sp.]MBA3595829.1 pyrroline-5-carboxylate reductase [Methylibium sp.]